MANLLFNKWSTEGIKVQDPGLISYICLDAKIVPATGSRNVNQQFRKTKMFIVERFINKIIVPGHKSKKHFISSGHICGQKHQALQIVKEVFTEIEKKIKKNPVEVFVKAIENAAPREEIIAIEYGGARYPKAVDITPQRRIDMALRQFVQGSYQKCFNKKKSIVETLTEEIILAYQLNQNSTAIAKKLELERQCDSSK